MFKFDSNCQLSLFTQLLEHDREKTAHYIITYFGGSLLYNALHNVWTPELHESIISNYLADYPANAPFMEKYLAECKNDYAMTK
jgi:hypothetical protein